MANRPATNRGMEPSGRTQLCMFGMAEKSVHYMIRGNRTECIRGDSDCDWEREDDQE